MPKKKNPKNQKPLLILSLDGGGIRGIIPALILAEIEKRTKKPTSDLFDIISGTSTGGVLAICLTKPGIDGRPQFTARDIFKLYQVHGKRIFHRSIFHTLWTCWGLFASKFPAKNFDSVLTQYLGDTKLSQATTGLLIPSYDIERRQPHFFKTRHALNPREPHTDFLMRDVAKATSAAPTYFPPAKIPLPDSDGDYLALIDGGMFANNPSVCAFAEGIKFLKEKQAKNFPIHVISIGTGNLTKRLPFHKACHWGAFGWALPVLDVLLTGPVDAANYQMNQFLPDNFIRLQLDLPPENETMDDVSSKNIKSLKSLTQKFIRQNSDQIDQICKFLTK